MCFFNVEVLRAKIADAKMVLDSSDKEEEPKVEPSAAPVPVTPQAKKISTTPLEDSPQTPALSSRGPSAASSPVPVTPSSTSYTNRFFGALARRRDHQTCELLFDDLAFLCPRLIH
ncbi:hypothetical protein J3R82DRAFT_6933 [Butyriboletus roseoflavus]|nr:hypothetical protein J3R82DRAFT_6933 [Butyriboletus roseoflavus]